jgi:pimeloyl-ACP methyl ester carboxylesterase
MFVRFGIYAASAGVVTCAAAVLFGKVLEYLSEQRLRKNASKLVEVSPGNFLNVTIKGEGSPIVILDAGLGMSGLSWHWVQSKVSPHTKTVTIDRPGLGCSPAGKGHWMRRVDTIVEWMETLVSKVPELQGDLVLVGHSTSGMHARLFCHRNPDRVKGMVLVDTAHEAQLGKLEGNSVYNSYPPPEVTEAKLQRLRSLSATGLLRLMYACSGPSFMSACRSFPPLVLLLRLLDALGRAAAVAQRRNVDILGPHFPPALRRRFEDEQLSAAGMAAMIAEHGSQRASMEHMQALDLLRPAQLSPRPLIVLSRDPAVGAGGRLYAGARGDPAREGQHAGLQRELAALSSDGVHAEVRGAGHGSLLFVERDAAAAAAAVLDVVAAVRAGEPVADVRRRRLQGA